MRPTLSSSRALRLASTLLRAECTLPVRSHAPLSGIRHSSLRAAKPRDKRSRTRVPPTQASRRPDHGRPPPLSSQPRPSHTSPQENSPPPLLQHSSSVEAISTALHNADASQNNLLSPVHIPEDENGVLNERHPATSILANSSIVVTRQLELMNIMMGFEQANKYVIMDGSGQHVGFMAEKDLGMGSMFRRQMFGTHRSFETHIFDRHGKEVLRFHRPFSWISSRIGIYDPVSPDDRLTPSTATTLAPITPGSLTNGIDQDAVRVSPLPLSEMPIIGEAQQQWAPLRRKYNLFVHRESTNDSTPLLASGDLPLSHSTALQPSSADAPQSGGQFGQFAYVDEPFLSWDFSLFTQEKKLLGSVNRNFSGFGREIFTDTGVYALRMDSAALTQEPSHLISQSGQQMVEPTAPGMTLDQRAVMLATAVSVDFDYFTRQRRGGLTGGFFPLWFPGVGGGEAAGAGEAGAEAGAEAGSGGRALEDIPGHGESGAGGVVAGAGAYEVYQHGLPSSGDGNLPAGADPNAAQSQPPDYGGQDQWPQQHQGQWPQQGQDSGQGQQGEDVWGTGSDPWSDGNQSDGGEGGSWLDIFNE